MDHCRQPVKGRRINIQLPEKKKPAVAVWSMELFLIFSFFLFSQDLLDRQDWSHGLTVLNMIRICFSWDSCRRRDTLMVEKSWQGCTTTCFCKYVIINQAYRSFFIGDICLNYSSFAHVLLMTETSTFNYYVDSFTPFFFFFFLISYLD